MANQEPEKFDAEGTTASGATEILQKLLHAFDNDQGKLALALGRNDEEIKHALSGNAEAFDDDLVQKMRGLAQQRSIEL